MADEVVEQPEAVTEDGGLVVEVVPDDKGGKPQLPDEEVSKLSELPAEDEIKRYAQDAQKRIKGMHIANQEWRRRVVAANRDVATATTLAEQLYRENQQLKANMGRSEQALIEQGIQRATAQLEQAKARYRAAIASQDGDAQAVATEEVSRCVAEIDRLKLLKPAAGQASAPSAEGTEQPSPVPSQPQSQPQPVPVTARTRAWVERNPWFENAAPNSPEEEMVEFAMTVHRNLEKKGITEASDPDRYFGTIDRRLREVYPQRFKDEPAAQPTAQPATRRPVAVTGATRVNGGTKGTPRQVTLSESEVRIARSLGLTPEQYAAQLIKDQAKEKETIQ